MILSTSDSPRFCTRFSDGTHGAVADTTLDKGGSSAGFRPHDLLEAALATCVNMAVRMFAETQRIPLAKVTTRVRLDRTGPDETIFRYDVELTGELTPEQEQKLLLAARACPVRRTLSKTIRFESGVGVTD